MGLGISPLQRRFRFFARFQTHPFRVGSGIRNCISPWATHYLPCCRLPQELLQTVLESHPLVDASRCVLFPRLPSEVGQDELSSHDLLGELHTSHCFRLPPRGSAMGVGISFSAFAPDANYETRRYSNKHRCTDECGSSQAVVFDEWRRQQFGSFTNSECRNQSLRTKVRRRLPGNFF